MKKVLSVFVAVLMSFALATVVFAKVDNPGAGYYEKIHGANAGEIKYFPNGHPENQSEVR